MLKKNYDIQYNKYLPDIVLAYEACEDCPEIAEYIFDYYQEVLKPCNLEFRHEYFKPPLTPLSDSQERFVGAFYFKTDFADMCAAIRTNLGHKLYHKPLDLIIQRKIVQKLMSISEENIQYRGKATKKDIEDFMRLDSTRVAISTVVGLFVSYLMFSPECKEVLSRNEKTYLRRNAATIQQFVMNYIQYHICSKPKKTG